MLVPKHAAGPSCRLCGAPLRRTFVDLGKSPLCESLLTAQQLDDVEPFYPLHVRICEECLLVQLEAYVPAEEIFRDYVYYSSYSDSWVAHAAGYTEAVVERLRLDSSSLVVELASNDGYLLQHFVQRGIPALGIDPAANVAEAARERGVETIVAFFDSRLAGQLVADGRRPNLVVANNVLAQVPELNDFVAGIEKVLAPDGVATIEVPHIVRLIEGLQFDTIYHEHYSYFSLTTLSRLFGDHGLEIYDVEELASHGGSLRVYLKRRDDDSHAVTPAVADVLEREHVGGYDTVDGYADFSRRVEQVKWELLELLIGLRRDGQTGRGLRRARQGKHATQLLRHPNRPARLHRRPKSAQAREASSRNAYPDLCSEQDRGDSARLHPRVAVEPQERDHGAACTRPGVGSAADRSDSAPRGALMAFVTGRRR